MTITNRIEPRKTIVFFHDNCSDGITAAVAAFIALNGEAEHILPHLQFVPVTYNNKFLVTRSQLHNSDVVFVDFAPTPIQLQAFIDAGCHSVEVIDHHQTSFDNLRQYNDVCKAAVNNLADINIDLALSESGATMTYKRYKHLMCEGDVRAIGNAAHIARRHDLWLHNGDYRDQGFLYAKALTGAYLVELLKERDAMIPVYNGKYTLFKLRDHCYKNISSDRFFAGDDLDSLLKAYHDGITTVIQALYGKVYYSNDLINEGREAIDELLSRVKPKIEKADIHVAKEIGDLRFYIVGDLDGDEVSIVAPVINEMPQGIANFVVTYKESSEGYKISLRTLLPSGHARSNDLTKVAKKIEATGGGHVDAAGAFIPMSVANGYINIEECIVALLSA